jgi:hypothetical protein
MNPYTYPYFRMQNRNNIATSNNNEIVTRRRDPFGDPFEDPLEDSLEDPFEQPGRAFSSARIPHRMSTTPRDFHGSPRTPAYYTVEPQNAPQQEDIRRKAADAAEVSDSTQTPK